MYLMMDVPCPAVSLGEGLHLYILSHLRQIPQDSAQAVSFTLNQQALVG